VRELYVTGAIEMTDKLYTQSHDEKLKAEFSAVMERIADFVEANVPYAQGIGSVGTPMAQHIREKLIPTDYASALDRRLAEARLEEAIMWNDSCDDCTEMPPQFFNWSAERIAELHRAVKGESK
jgi:hypothetical protein